MPKRCFRSTKFRRIIKFGLYSIRFHRATSLGSLIPLCELALEKKFNFIVICLPEPHQMLYQWLDFLAANRDIDQLPVHHWNGRFTQIATYRFINEVPLRGGDKALNLNWRQVIITHSKTSEHLGHNAFVTNHLLTDQTALEVVKAGRTRWKGENENNNVLKTKKGYHLEHNFGHGKLQPDPDTR